MSRSQLSNIVTSLQSDSGSVLWSFVRGEQLEFPVILNFIPNASAGYVFEAVVVEANNVIGQQEMPSSVKSGGVQTVLTVRVPTDRGTWAAITAYDTDDLVKYGSLYYKLRYGAAYVSGTLPTVDPNWEEWVPNKIFIRFPASLGATWGVPPTTGANSYGFFELRVTEPAGPSFRRTWKPLRGMVEVLFSPTDIVADV
jgi:hypothetical protein